MWSRLRRPLLLPRCLVETFQHQGVFAHAYEVVFALDLVMDGVLSEVMLFQDRVLLQEPERIVKVDPACP